MYYPGNLAASIAITQAAASAQTNARRQRLSSGGAEPRQTAEPVEPPVQEKRREGESPRAFLKRTFRA